MEQITIRIQEDLLKSIEDEAAEHDASRSEHIRRLIEKGSEHAELKDRLAAREDRIEDLEEQLRRRSQIEEEVEELAVEVREQRAAAQAPFPVRWYRWWKD